MLEVQESTETTEGEMIHEDDIYISAVDILVLRPEHTVDDLRRYRREMLRLEREAQGESNAHVRQLRQERQAST